ncbi:MAG: hypothetical protein CSB13_05950, partial [Chloroflexi bacterium]
MLQKRFLTTTLLTATFVALWLIILSISSTPLNASPTELTYMQSTYDCAAQSAIPPTECEALVAIYNANPDASLNGWLAAGSSPCDWSGVYCSGGGVDELNLEQDGLTMIPAGIGDLTNLTYLNLHGNQLTALPPEIGDLTELTKLWLPYNQLTILP